MAETVVGHRKPRLLDGGGEDRASNSPGMIARFAILLRARRRVYVVQNDKTVDRLQFTERQMSPCAADMISPCAFAEVLIWQPGPFRAAFRSSATGLPNVERRQWPMTRRRRKAIDP
jgi:hypothetical protein